MSVNVPMERLRAELEGRGNVAYLLTVGADGRPHSVAVSVHWEAEALVMGSGTTSTRNAAARRLVTLLAPPVGADGAGGAGGGTDRAPEQGYSLIVDGEVTAATASDDGGGTVRVRPTHAVLHRPAAGADGAEAHDCDHVFDETQT